MMTAYLVPAVKVRLLLLKSAVLKPPPPPSLKPAIVAVARSAPVGTGVAPVVALIETVMFGELAVQLAQKSSKSTRFNVPVTAGVNVWPAQLVSVMPKPVG